MKTIIGVRFRRCGKVYYFSPLNYNLVAGNHVIVETARGVEYGEVAIGNRDIDETTIPTPIKPIIRVANEADAKHHEENQKLNKDAFKIGVEKAKARDLDMKMLLAEYTFDNNKIIFYFTADGRVDFRELVKDLAAVFRTRIELRQIQVRDAAKLLGGLGVCGREACCCLFQSEPVSISIKMAKEQGLSLNISKLSGVCGKLMCCLAHEQEVYEELNKTLPHVGDVVKLEDGRTGTIQSLNVLSQKAKVIVTNDNDEKEIVETQADALVVKSKKGCGGCAAGKVETNEEPLSEGDLIALEDEVPVDDNNQAKQGKNNRPKQGGQNRGNNQNNNHSNNQGNNQGGNKNKKNYNQNGKNNRNGGAGENAGGTKNNQYNHGGKKNSFKDRDNAVNMAQNSEDSGKADA